MSFPRIDETHDPARASWVEGADRHPDLPIQNLPYGIFSPPGGAARAGVAIGERIFDLRAAAQSGLLPAAASAVLGGTTLNALMALPASDRLALRRWLSALFSDEAQRHAIEPLLHPAADRSEEHTSELQSLMRISYAVFCLKNKKQNKTT